MSSRNDSEDFVELCRYFSELSPQPMVAVEGLTQTIRYVNPAFCRLAGKTSRDMIKRSFSEFMPSDHVSLLDRVFRTGMPESLINQEQSVAPARFWSYSCWSIFGQERKPTGVMVQVTDSTHDVIFKKTSADMNQSLLISGMHQHELTEKAERLNQDLQVATKAKNQFLASMSHEIRTPINVIMGFSELLSMNDQSRADRKNYGERIKRQADLLMRLIDDILDLSKVEAGRLQIEKIEVALPELISDTRMVMQHLAEEKGLRFSLDHDDPLPGTIVCDPIRLKQILTNIIANAIKFTAEGSVQVNIRVNREQQKLHFIVKDTGSGMTPEQASRVFQPFTQADSSTTRKFGGTGLGLDLARRLAQALGGDVVIVTTTEGVGSIFEITISLESPVYHLAQPAAQKPANEAQISLKGLHVLVADDGVDNQFLVARYLTMAGALVDLANDGEEAVAMALDGDYDLILMDIQMPNLNGYAATMKLRGMGCEVPVIALTAHALQSDIDKCRQAGCDAHLSKPLRWQSLIETVHQVIKERSRSIVHAGDHEDSKALF